MISQKCVNIFVPNFAHLFRTELCKVWSFKIDENAQTLATNYATVQKVDFIIKGIESPIPPLL